MFTTLLDYEVLARQKSESMLADAKRRHALVRFAEIPNRNALQALVGLFLGRFGPSGRPTVNTRVA
jgi:hypothetical protein